MCRSNVDRVVQDRGRLSGVPEGDPPMVYHDEDKSSEPGPEEPDPTGVCEERHPHSQVSSAWSWNMWRVK